MNRHLIIFQGFCPFTFLKIFVTQAMVNISDQLPIPPSYPRGATEVSFIVEPVWQNIFNINREVPGLEKGQYMWADPKGIL